MNTEHRPTPTERLHEVTMSVLNRQPSSPESTVELTRNAKGDVQISVTVRSTDAGEATADAINLFDLLCERYPRTDQAPSGSEGK